MECRHDIPTPAALQDSQLDAEELKDALLQQAMAQRRALVSSSLRSGSGRNIKKPKFHIGVRYDVLVGHKAVPSDGGAQARSGVGAGVMSMTSTQQATIQTPFTFQQPKPLSPMEGVPERIGGDAMHPPKIVAQAPVWNQVHEGKFSPMEGIPECHVIVADRKVPPKAQSRLGRDSPIEGVVQQSAMQPAVDPTPVGYGADDNGGAYDDYGYDDDFGGGFDDYGGADDYGFDGGNLDAPEAAQPSVPKTIAPGRKRIILNPGVRLRNELPRKSLITNKNVGRQEVAPGIRRSTRRSQEPLRWWLGEKKEFNRVSHKTMPTVAAVTQADPDTPWRTVDDPKGARQDKMKVKKLRKVPKMKKPKAPHFDSESDEEIHRAVTKRQRARKGTASGSKRKQPEDETEKVQQADNMQIMLSDDETLMVNAEKEVADMPAQEAISDDETLVINGKPDPAPHGMKEKQGPAKPASSPHESDDETLVINPSRKTAEPILVLTGKENTIVSDDETVVIGARKAKSLKTASKSKVQTGQHDDEDQDATVEIRSHSPKPKGTPTSAPTSAKIDVIVEGDEEEAIRQEEGNQALLLEADDSVGSADNTDELQLASPDQNKGTGPKEQTPKSITKGTSRSAGKVSTPASIRTAKADSNIEAELGETPKSRGKRKSTPKSVKTTEHVEAEQHELIPKEESGKTPRRSARTRNQKKQLGL